MNLYSINFGHWSPKDSEYGIKGYVLAENDEAVLDWLLEGQKMNGERVSTYWKDSLKEDEEDGGTTRERLLENKGQLDDEECLKNLSDFYYGARLFGWALVKEVTPAESETLLSIGIAQQAK